MLPGEHFAILSTFVSLRSLFHVIKIFVLSILEWPFNTGFTVPVFCHECNVDVFLATEITKNLANFGCSISGYFTV